MKSQLNKYIIITALLAFFAFPSGAQGNGAQEYCQTGHDANLPAIKTKIKNMSAKIMRLKTQRVQLRARLEPLKEQILALDSEIKPLRDKHRKAAKKSQKGPKSYAKYKAKWLDTGELNRLNGLIKTRKTKHTKYKSLRVQYLRADQEFKKLGGRYQHIAGTLLDKNRDCAAAQTALMRD